MPTMPPETPVSAVSNARWAAYDVTRSRLLIDICELGNVLSQEQAKAEPDRARIEAIEADIDALELKFDLLSVDDFSG